jgi:putative nucleotidyltransferase with HDIG domain
MSGTSSVVRWPWVVAATALVVGMPACLVTFLAPSDSMPHALGGVAVAVVVSMATAKIGEALWMRHPLARDVLFGDLMLWEWLRRLWVEHRLTRAQSALSAGDAPGQERAEALRNLARLLEARDSYTHGHSRRVARHALRIAQALHVPAAEAERIWTAATLHDVGKLYTPREILNKPGRLTDEEFEVIKRHPVDGAAMLVDIGDPELVAIVRSHHERLDGAGYPDGLAGAAIPLGARVIAVADTFDALTSTRSYRSAASHKRALDILRKEAGTQLDGAAVDAFVRTYSGRRPAALSALIALAPQRLVAWLGHEATAVASLAPATGWIAPAAAAAAAMFGFSSAVPDGAAPQHGASATPIVAVRAQSSARVATVVAAAPARPREAPAPAKARRPAKRDRTPAPKPGGAKAPSQQPAAQQAPFTAAATTTRPASDEPSSPAPTADAPVHDVVAAVKTAPPAAPPVSLPVQTPQLPIPAVQGVVDATVAQVNEVLPQTTPLLQP